MPKCLTCGKEVKNKFCSYSCENKYYNKIRQIKYLENPKLCNNCGKPLP